MIKEQNSSTYKTFLMQKKTTAYEKLCDIKDFPNLGGEPEMLETTTLSDPVQTFIMGIQNSDSMAFTMNYNPKVYKELKALQEAGTELDLSVWFGGTENAGVITPTGDFGKFNFKGTISVYVTGGGVNEVRGMTLSVARSTVITPDFGEE